ncbi:hypothetical protein ACFYXM_12000 [Streptomyces sp. NPDC002476]|uniref:hypothetical protein n=1 Tax=Streptomyces sp. NPDC002476 TaxID=3364648 RepID=UPI00369F3261
MDHHLEQGQIYRACTPADGPPRYVRVVRQLGGRRIRIADAATGKREREVNASQLREYPTGRGGAARRAGYVHVLTSDWFNDLVDGALRGHPYIVAATSMEQDALRGGILRLRPEVSLPAVRAVVTALEAAAWTVEPSLEVADELRVRFRGQPYCPAMYRSSGEVWICQRFRGHDGEHQDNVTYGVWENEGVAELVAWWLPGQPLPGHVPAGA